MITKAIRFLLLCACYCLCSAAEYRIAVADVPNQEIWKNIIKAMAKVDPANRYTLQGPYPVRRLIELGKSGEFDAFLPGGSTKNGQTLFGFANTGRFVFYSTDILLLSLPGKPALNQYGQPSGEIETAPGMEHLFPFPVSVLNSPDRSVKKLLAGRIVAVGSGKAVLEQLIKLHNIDNPVLTHVATGEVKFGLTPRQGWQVTADHLDKVMQRMRDSGELAVLLQPITKRLTP